MWKTVKLGDVCDVLDSLRKPITKKFRSQGEYPYYGATGIVDWVDNYIFDEKLVLVGEDGAKWSAGDKTAFIADGKYWVNNHAHVLRPHANTVTHEWIAYYLTAIDLKDWVTGLTVPKLNQAQMRSIPIPLPPLAEQQRIVEKLDIAFEEIDRASEATERRRVGVKALTSAVLAQELNSSDLAKTVKLGDVCEIQPKKSDIKQISKSDTFVSFMGMDTLPVDKKNAISTEERTISSVYRAYTYFLENDVLLAKITPCFENGKLGIARGLKNGIGFGSSEFFVYRCGSEILPEYLYYFLRSDFFRNEGKKRMSGAVGHKRVEKDYLTTAEILLPPLAEQQKIVEKLDQVFSSSDEAWESFSNKLYQYKQLKSAILALELKGPES